MASTNLSWLFLCVFLSSSGGAQAFNRLLYRSSAPASNLNHRHLWNPFSYHSVLFHHDNPFQSMRDRSLLSGLGDGFGPSLRLWEPSQNIQRRLQIENLRRPKCDEGKITCNKQNDATSTSEDVRHHPHTGSSHQEPDRVRTSNQDRYNHEKDSRGTTSNQQENSRDGNTLRDGISFRQGNRQWEPVREISNQLHKYGQRETVRGATSNHQHGNRLSEPLGGTTYNLLHNYQQKEQLSEADRNHHQDHRQSTSKQNMVRDENIDRNHPRRGHHPTRSPPLREISRLSIKGYHPADVKVTLLRDGVVHVKGIQSCGCEENCLEKEFERKISLPRQIDPRTVRAIVKADDQNVLVIKGSRKETNGGIQVPTTGLIIPIEGDFEPVKRNSDPSCGGTKRGIKLKKMDARSKQIIDDVKEAVTEEKYEGEIDEDGVTIEIAE